MLATSGLPGQPTGDTAEGCDLRQDSILLYARQSQAICGNNESWHCSTAAAQRREEMINLTNLPSGIHDGLETKRSLL